jgi:hypothetical protein
VTRAEQINPEEREAPMFKNIKKMFAHIREKAGNVTGRIKSGQIIPKSTKYWVLAAVGLAVLIPVSVKLQSAIFRAVYGGGSFLTTLGLIMTVGYYVIYNLYYADDQPANILKSFGIGLLVSIGWTIATVLIIILFSISILLLLLPIGIIISILYLRATLFYL